jgi:hypothetical protein
LVWIDHAPVREDESREVSHHGTMLPAGGETDEKELFKPSKKKIDLISRNEKVQVEVRTGYKIGGP